MREGRQDPITSAPLVAAAIFFCGLLRIRSLNALEPRLAERTFVRLVGAPPEREDLCSADTLSRSLRSMALERGRAMSVGIVQQAERNKVFREGWVGAQRYVALDGWEPLQSFGRHCDRCLVRVLKVKQRDGTFREVEQYYHRFAVAMLIDERFDLLLDYEPLLPADLRPAGASKDHEDEGELTAGRRLLRRVKQTYGWVDVVVADGLYPNGPFLTDVKHLRMGAVVVLRKETDEPLKDALAIWGSSPASQTVEANGPRGRERIELWDCPGIETLGTYDGPIRVVRGRVTYLDDPARDAATWCVAVTGSATRLSPAQVLRIARGGGTSGLGFHQWTTRWHFGHVRARRRCDAGAVLVVLRRLQPADALPVPAASLYATAAGRHAHHQPARRRMLDELAPDRSPWDTSWRRAGPRAKGRAAPALTCRVPRRGRADLETSTQP